MNRAHNGSLGDAVLFERGRHLVEPRAHLEIDLDTNARGLVGEPSERFVQREQLWRDLAKLGERPLADASSRDPVADLLESIRVSDHERSLRESEHVELDDVDAERDGRAEPLQGVLWCDARSTTMPHDKGTTVTAEEVDHAAESVADPEDGALHAEQTLNLVHDENPDREDGRDEDQHDEPEAKPRAPLLPMPFDARATPCPMESIRPLDRPRVQRRRVFSLPKRDVGLRGRSPLIDHVKSVVPLRKIMSARAADVVGTEDR